MYNFLECDKNSMHLNELENFQLFICCYMNLGSLYIFYEPEYSKLFKNYVYLLPYRKLNVCHGTSFR